MKHLFALVVFGIFSPVADAQADKDKVAELEGRWQVASLVAGGRLVAPAKGVPTSLVVKKGTANFYADGTEIPTFRNLTLRPDPAKGSKAIDIIRDQALELPCLYVVTADEFKLAMPLVPQDRKPGELLPRPESFDSKDKPVLVFTMKRSKG